MPRFKRDAALIYCFEHSLGLVKAQALLSEPGLPLLGGRKITDIKSITDDFLRQYQPPDFPKAMMQKYHLTRIYRRDAP